QYFAAVPARQPSGGEPRAAAPVLAAFGGDAWILAERGMRTAVVAARARVVTPLPQQLRQLLEHEAVLGARLQVLGLQAALDRERLIEPTERAQAPRDRPARDAQRSRRAARFALGQRSLETAEGLLGATELVQGPAQIVLDGRDPAARARIA